MIQAVEIPALELDSVLERMRRGPAKNEPKEVHGAHFNIKGLLDMVCREADQVADDKWMGKGDPVWEVHQPNLITDWGRRAYANNAFSGQHIYTSPLTLETPSIFRQSFFDGGSNLTSQSNGVGAGSWTALTLTKTYSTTFNPILGNNRTIGAVGLGFYNVRYGVYFISTVSLIAPPKVQSPTQILEISYRLVLTPP